MAEKESNKEKKTVKPSFKGSFARKVWTGRKYNIREQVS